jgi:ATP-dependent Clp protease ATP-binding subunit ClpC
MYERFTQRARKVMQLATPEAMRLNHEYIGTEHLLLALIREGSGVAANILWNLDIDLTKIRRTVEQIVTPGPEALDVGNLPQTPRAKKVIEYAIDEARGLNHNYVGTEHLLLGLIREEEGVAQQVLTNAGLCLATVREELVRFLGPAPVQEIMLDPGATRATPARPSEPPPENADVPPLIRKALKHLDGLVEVLGWMKESAIADQNFDWAAMLRDKSHRLFKLREFLLQERHREKG